MKWLYRDNGHFCKCTVLFPWYILLHCPLNGDISGGHLLNVQLFTNTTATLVVSSVWRVLAKDGINCSRLACVDFDTFSYKIEWPTQTATLGMRKRGKERERGREKKKLRVCASSKGISWIMSILRVQCECVHSLYFSCIIYSKVSWQRQLTTQPRDWEREREREREREPSATLDLYWNNWHQYKHKSIEVHKDISVTSTAMYQA